jgi:subtilisin-like proprotein convertase family protein
MRQLFTSWIMICGVSFAVGAAHASWRTEDAAPAQTLATTVCSPIASVAITDDAYNGMFASMSSLPLVVPNVGVLSKVTVTGLALDHTWVGDLTIKLRSPSATIVTLMSRPGVLEATDNGTAIGGDSSNMSSIFPVAFQDGAAASAENMGSAIGNTGVVCRDDAICAYDPNAGAAPSGKLSTFIGQASSGTWSLAVGDSSFGDIGTLVQFCLTIELVSTDADGDGVPDASDCAPSNPAVWSAPSEAVDLRVAKGVSIDLSWTPPASPGGTAVLYDVLRSTDPAVFAAGPTTTCVASDSSSAAASDPFPDAKSYYLVRSQNVCGDTLGSRSDGSPRLGQSCP